MDESWIKMRNRETLYNYFEGSCIIIIFSCCTNIALEVIPDYMKHLMLVINSSIWSYLLLWLLILTCDQCSDHQSHASPGQNVQFYWFPILASNLICSSLNFRIGGMVLKIFSKFSRNQGKCGCIRIRILCVTMLLESAWETHQCSTWNNNLGPN